ncbi:hypothetical protein X907_0170 [Glycocaulis alkaliphilus]|uniref:DUF1223 domain-containing protein n=1 Tax=Glycocaulis alkaliphilus TaxID=1434191 RepID=A0A3T0E617_9PROT|nr:DUF1223 domain-containing protein [Glycocaulis alkaliphilus]AZU02720.1 hypothetical protein X907_0170 [Glycocaulis alkaliphilus]
MMMIPALLALSLIAADVHYPAGIGETPNPDHSEDRPVVVELFTSQGCPPCVEANRRFGDIAARDGVIALSYGVDYWDMFGWEDQFAQPAFADRQKDYIRAGEANRVFTPHFVINGGPERLRFTRDDVPGRVARTLPLSGIISLTPLSGGQVQLELEGPVRASPAEVWAITYRPGLIVVPIEGGRNEGAQMEHHNTVASLERLEDWHGGDYSLEFAGPAEDFGLAVLVQDGPGGRLLAASRLRD